MTSHTAEQLVQQKVAAIQEKVRLGEPVEGEYLTHLLLSVRYTKELSRIRIWQWFRVSGVREFLVTE